MNDLTDLIYTNKTRYGNYRKVVIGSKINYYYDNDLVCVSYGDRTFKVCSDKTEAEWLKETFLFLGYKMAG